MASKNNQIFLFIGIKQQILFDNSDYRKALIEEIFNSHKIIKFIDYISQKNHQFQKFIWFLYFIATFLKIRISGNGRRLYIYKFKNEETFLKNQIHTNFCSLKFNYYSVPKNLYKLIKNISYFIKLNKIEKRVSLNSQNIISHLRIAELLAIYFQLEFFKEMFEELIFLSDSNPHGVAAMSHAYKYNKRNTFIKHGLTLFPLSKIPYDKIIVLSETCKKMYQDNAKVNLVECISHTQNKKMKVLSKNLKVGICLSKDTNNSRLNGIINKIKNIGIVSEVHLKPHPSFNITKLSIFKGVKVCNLDIIDFLNTIDIVVLGNSSSAYEALLEGVPVVYESSLDGLPYDCYQLLKNNIIIEGVEKIANINDSIYFTSKWNSNLLNQFNVNSSNP